MFRREIAKFDIIAQSKGTSDYASCKWKWVLVNVSKTFAGFDFQIGTFPKSHSKLGAEDFT